MLTASLTSSVGIAINIATTLAGNPAAWVAVVVTTTASGGAAAWISGNQAAAAALVIEENLDEEVPKLHRSEKRSISKGVVKRRTVETRPDGTRLETIEFFSEELAREDTD
jgi:hypothetical protein